MGRIFKHLSFTDRLRLEEAIRLKVPVKDIAKSLNVHNSTIYRELKRGRYTKKRSVYDCYGEKSYRYRDTYSPDIAHEKYRSNLQAKGAPLKIGNDFALANYIEDRILNGGLTPLAVLGEIKRNNLHFDTSICLRTLYSYIYKGVFLSLSIKNLPLASKRKHKKRRLCVQKAPRGESIEKRPAEVAERSTFGHWEMDCVCGSSKSTLLVLTERLTRKEIIFPMLKQTKENVLSCLNILEHKYLNLFSSLFKTITVDNGSEFSDCLGMEASSIYPQKRRTKIYYCHPYCSCERGTNERMNREIRRKIPKGSDLSSYSESDIKNIESWLNSYPRQVLDFATADELFSLHMSAL